MRSPPSAAPPGVRAGRARRARPTRRSCCPSRPAPSRPRRRSERSRRPRGRPPPPARVSGRASSGPGTKSSKNDGNIRLISGPGAWTTLAPGSLARIPSRTVTAAGTWPNTIHEPSVSAFESASGPMTATLVSALESGSACPSLRSRTIDRCAARRASCRCSGAPRTCAARDSSAYGFSNRPRRTFDGQDRPNRRVDLGHGDGALLHERRQGSRDRCRWPSPCRGRRRAPGGPRPCGRGRSPGSRGSRRRTRR